MYASYEIRPSIKSLGKAQSVSQSVEWIGGSIVNALLIDRH